MLRRLIKLERVALSGSIIGTVSLFIGWLTLRPNRLAAGSSTNLWEAFGGYWGLYLTLLWLICVVLSLLNVRRRGLWLGIMANATLVLTFILVGHGAGRLLEGAPDITRISLGGGVWMTLAGAYAVIYAARQELQEQPIWRNLISWIAPCILAILLGVGWFNDLSIIREFSGYRQRFLQEFLQHVRLFGTSVVIATVIGIPLGVWATHNRYAERPIFFVTNITQTVPSLALFGILMAPLSALSFAFPWLRDFGIRGVGVAPAVIALTIYSLLPITRNTFAGIRQIDVAALDAGIGMGMNRWQLFHRVEAPLAAPLALEGIRTAAVQAVGLTAVAALIGAGGLGWFVFQGIGQAAPDMIILGAIPIIILALLVDGIMRTSVKLATPRGLMRET